MASKRAVERAAKRAAFSDDDIDALAEKLYRMKYRVFRRTLRGLRRRYTGDDQLPTLSEDVDAELHEDALRSARQIAKTFNSDLAEIAARSRVALRDDELDEAYEKWARGRQRKRAKLIAVTEAYSVHADATLSFFKDAGVEDVTFEFGGHPELGDETPACDICIAIASQNPHSLESVLAIGTPHPNCRQLWHPNFDVRDLPDDFDLGNSLGGILGQPSLIERNGNSREHATAFVERQAE